MTIAQKEARRTRVNYYCVDAGDDDTQVAERKDIAAGPSAHRHSYKREASRVGFTNRWHRPDAVLELLEELVTGGRVREAAAIRRVLGHDDDEAAMRAYVSRLWAEDWDSPEDSAYDD
jgi:hypothetical protein